MDNEIQSQNPATESFAGETSEEQPKKRKISAMNIIILIILLGLISVAVLYYLGDASKLGQCSSKEECGRYNVFYISGQGYVCANDQTAGESSIRTKILMFKYASKKATTNEPADCSCVESQCEAIQ